MIDDLNEIKILLKELVERLAQNKIDLIMKSGQNGRLSEEEIKGAIDSYPGVISLPHENSYSDMVVFEVDSAYPDSRLGEFDLWFDGEVSDLTLSFEVQQDKDGRMSIQIDDIHVL
jgi:hypothetical protein